jgi:hypothetical protein
MYGEFFSCAHMRVRIDDFDSLSFDVNHRYLPPSSGVEGNVSNREFPVQAIPQSICRAQNLCADTATVADEILKMTSRVSHATHRCNCQA